MYNVYIFFGTLCVCVCIYIYVYIYIYMGTAAAQWLRPCATNRKVAGSIPAGVSRFFIDKILPILGRLSL